jgi:hypothetical protein
MAPEINYITSVYGIFPTPEGETPRVYLEPNTHQKVCELAKHREKKWASTTRWNNRADELGLLGELAAFKYFDVPAETVAKQFVDGLNGDRGVDLEWAGEQVDVKTTGRPELRYRFNKTNGNRSRASVILFTQVADQPQGGVLVTLHGWSYKHKIQPFLRDVPDSNKRQVRLSTLLREGVVQPVAILKKGELA